jgi:hypothetical protein
MNAVAGIATVAAYFPDDVELRQPEQSTAPIVGATQ